MWKCLQINTLFAVLLVVLGLVIHRGVSRKMDWEGQEGVGSPRPLSFSRLPSPSRPLPFSPPPLLVTSTPLRSRPP